MARVQTNAVEVKEAIGRLRRLGSFNGHGRYKTLGEDIPDLIAESLVDRYVLRQQEPGGEPLAELSDDYREEKTRKGFPDVIGVRTGKMLSFEELRGEVDIAENVLEMTYGTSEETRLRMEWFTEGFRKQNRPPRPGYELDDRDVASLDLLVFDSIERTISDLGGEEV